MRLLSTLPEAEPDVALFGHGRIGAAIRTALEHRCPRLRMEAHPFAWTDPAAQADQARALRRRLEAASTRLAIVWSAGRAGLGATEAQTATELDSLRTVVDLARRLADRRPVEFHLVSSAGGLFEGQRAVAAGTPPVPRSAYGRLKLEQERLLQGAGFDPYIYRPSSVYGPIRADVRAGLIPTLVRNGVTGAVTSIYGRLATLRDYVWSGDVGDFIADAVLAPGRRPAVYLLVSGRPVSLHEVKRTVEAVVRRRLYVSFQPPTNACDITFRPARPPHRRWTPHRLEAGVRMVHERWRAEGSLPRPGACPRGGGPDRK